MEETGSAINYLTKGFLIETNITHILEDEECPDKRFAGKIHNHDSLEYLIEIVKNDAYFSSIEEKAAQYCFKIITDHVFVDANKRTGCTSILAFVTKNGAYFRRLPDGLMINIATSIAKNTMAYEELVQVIAARIRYKKHRR